MTTTDTNAAVTLLREKIRDLRPPPTLIAQCDSYKEGFEKCRQMAASIVADAAIQTVSNPLRFDWTYEGMEQSTDGMYQYADEIAAPVATIQPAGDSYAAMLKYSVLRDSLIEVGNWANDAMQDHRITDPDARAQFRRINSECSSSIAKAATIATPAAPSIQSQPEAEDNPNFGKYRWSGMSEHAVTHCQPEASELPPLPEAFFHTLCYGRLFDEAKMHAHAAACVLADRARQAAQPEVENIDTVEFRKLTFAYADALMHGSVPKTSEAWAAVCDHVDTRLKRAGRQASKSAALQELVDQAQELDMGYGAKAASIAQPGGAVPEFFKGDTVECINERGHVYSAVVTTVETRWGANKKPYVHYKVRADGEKSEKVIDPSAILTKAAPQPTASAPDHDCPNDLVDRCNCTNGKCGMQSASAPEVQASHSGVGSIGDDAEFGRMLTEHRRASDKLATKYRSVIIEHIDARSDASAKDAERWRAFVGSARIKPQGSAGLESDTAPNGEPFNGYAHMGLEIWTTYGRDYSSELLAATDKGTALGREWLTKYADIAVAAAIATTKAAK